MAMIGSNNGFGRPKEQKFKTLCVYAEFVEEPSFKKSNSGSKNLCSA